MSYLLESYDYSDYNFVTATDTLSYWSSIPGQVLFDNLRLTNEKMIVDLGCGMGFPTMELAQRYTSDTKVIGIDRWELGLKRAREKALHHRVPNVEYIHALATDVPVDDGTIDLITANVVINMIQDRKKMIEECHRLLKPGGRLILTSNIRGQMKRFYTLYKEVLREQNLENYLADLEKFINHPISEEEMVEYLNLCGFKINSTSIKTHYMRFVNGTALFNAQFIKAGFLHNWKNFLPEELRLHVFEELENKINDEDDFYLDFPILYVEAQKI
ncbi:MAG: class I SAM-dependent methyltransferase [Candidatus Heimdallarchaeota archaeon]|nr:class I SAM-dependent methyltransferase [Candidatus Heimdallarchaeota archaeon]